VTREFLRAMWSALGGSVEIVDHVDVSESGDLPSVFAVSDFAAAAVGAAGAATAELVASKFGELPRVSVNRRLSSMWYGWSIRPDGWKMPAPWDPASGDYATADGWIRLHTNAAHHREAALKVLGVPADKAQVARAVAGWKADELESAVVESGGCAATMRSIEAWAVHPQGSCVTEAPLLTVQPSDDTHDVTWSPTPDRPLRGLRVLDLTRVLAGPVATRFLAGLGADVLRIDSPTWDEPGVVPDVTVGKRCARLDFRTSHALLAKLMSQAHVLVHGYRADALESLGFDAEKRREIRPGLVDVCLNAYGWDGPWKNRRGFDSLVQMSAGIAHAGMCELRKDKPTPLPVQALDHATGYLMAAAVIRGLSTGKGFEARTSLAGTAQLLVSRRAPMSAVLSPSEADWSEQVELTEWGPAHRLRSPVRIGQASLHWDRPAVSLGSSPPEFTP
jgi:CoA transferase family III